MARCVGCQLLADCDLRVQVFERGVVVVYDLILTAVGAHLALAVRELEEQVALARYSVARSVQCILAGAISVPYLLAEYVPGEYPLLREV